MSPVEHAADGAQLLAEVDDVPGNQLGGIDAQLDRVVLAVDAKGVEADRLEDIVALQPLEPAVDVGSGEGKHVAHVQPFGRRIGEHHEVVEGPLGPVQVGLVGVPLGPSSLPLGLDQVGAVGQHVGPSGILLHSRLGRLHGTGPSRRRPSRVCRECTG